MILVPTRRANTGFTLMEVLITVAILAVGLLGLAAMQVVGMRSNSGATFRSHATLVAADMMERMHANPLGVAQGLFVDFDSDTITGSCSSFPATYCSDYYGGTGPVAGASCPQPSDMATFDLYTISCGGRIGNSNVSDGLKALPEGRLLITCNASPCVAGTTHVIEVRWSEVDGNGAKLTKSIFMPFIPHSYPVQP